jgi:hypothetical protein
MDKAKQLMIAIMCDFPAKHEIRKSATKGAKTAEDLISADGFDKQDLFSLASNGKSFFEYHRTWKNLDRLIKEANTNGAPVSWEDFSENIKGSKSAFIMGAKCGAVKEMFNPLIWEGHEQEMENLWFSLTTSEQIGLDLNKFRRALAKHEGREIREDQLKKIGLTRLDIADVAQTGKWGKVKKKLNAAGDKLTKADLFLRDFSGDFVLDSRTKWDNADILFDEVIKNGELFKKNDFLRASGGRDSLLDSAAYYDRLEKIFNEEIWSGRPYEMMELYSYLPRDKQEDIDIEEVLMDVVNMQGLPRTLDQLVKPLKADQENDSCPLLPLSFISIWDNIEEIKENLKANGEKITLSHLLLKSGFEEQSCLKTAVKRGHFSFVIDILNETKETLPLMDLIEKDQNGRSVLDEIIDRDELGLVLNPVLWTGRSSELLTLMEEVPSFDREGYNFDDILSKTNQLTLRTQYSVPSKKANSGHGFKPF